MSDKVAKALDPVELALARTPARVLAGRVGPAYRTSTWLKLRADHAIARDAVNAENDLLGDLGADRVAEFGIFEVQTRATTKAEYLRRPDLGRRLAPDCCELVKANCAAQADLHVIIGDGLSATAIASQAPAMLDRLKAAAQIRNWSFGRPFFVRHSRVGVMNEVGDLLMPEVLVLLVGERPGLATAESLSAYLAYRPRLGHTDANRNLVSNIHPRGVNPDEACARVLALAEKLRSSGRSGFGVTEDQKPSLTIGPSIEGSQSLS